MNHLKHCFGCRTLTTIFTSPIDEIRECLYNMPNLNGECPCSRCIIKIMCDVYCTDFYTFRGLDHHILEKMLNEEGNKL